MKKSLIVVLSAAACSASIIAMAQPGAQPKPEPKKPESAGAQVIGFEDVEAGKLPAGWKAEGTNQKGPVATWQVVKDDKAPSGANVLKLTSVNHDSSGTYNLCWTDKLKFTEGEIEVKVRADAGEGDQGGGPMWRVKDKDNYYIARYNPLEENFRVYFVKDGTRKQLATADVSIPAGKWFTIRIEHAEGTITCSIDGTKHLTAKDSTLAEGGGVGVWTKADAATSFDDLKVTPKKPADKK